MIKIWDEELTQIRLRELQDKGVAVEIVGKGDLMQITEGWIHFGAPVCNYQLSEYTSLKHSEARESSLLKQIEYLEKEVAALKSQPGWELDVPENGWLADGFCIYNPSTGEGHSLESFVSHVCSRIRPAAPRVYTDADVEKLARVLDDAYEIAILSKPVWEDQSPTHQDRRRAQARAALDWMGAPMGECKECAARRHPGPLLESVAYWFKAEKEARERITAEIAARAALEGE